MKVLAVVGGTRTTRTGVVDALASALAAEGRVCTVSRPQGDADSGGEMNIPGADAARSAYTLAETGSWRGTGESAGFDAFLDDLVPDHDFALLAGVPHPGVPVVAVGERETGSAVLHRVTDPDAIDVDAVLRALESVEPRVTLESLVEEIKRADGEERSGAIATFTGRVRRFDGPDDEATEYLEFEKYEGVADERLATIGEELTAREGVYEVLVHHKTGVVEAGEDIVFVVVLAGHRTEAFETVEDGIDRLKDEVPLFKKEVTVEGEFWAHDPPSH